MYETVTTSPLSASIDVRMPRLNGSKAHDYSPADGFTIRAGLLPG